MTYTEKLALKRQSEREVQLQQEISQVRKRLNHVLPVSQVCTCCKLDLPAAEFASYIGAGGLRQLRKTCKLCVKTARKTTNASS
jgi:hypothetical protein